MTQRRDLGSEQLLAMHVKTGRERPAIRQAGTPASTVRAAALLGSDARLGLAGLPTTAPLDTPQVDPAMETQRQKSNERSPRQKLLCAFRIPWRLCVKSSAALFPSVPIRVHPWLLYLRPL